MGDEYVIFKKKDWDEHVDWFNKGMPIDNEFDIKSIEDAVVILINKDSKLVAHAKRELALLNNDEEFNESIINAIAAFASYSHSGGSASVAISLINDLFQFKNITPLTNDPSQWMEVGPNVSQSLRNSEAFSNDKGKSYTLLSETPPRHTSEEFTDGT